MSSEFYNWNIGVRQGENLSTILLSLYINDDLEEFLLNKKVVGLHRISNAIENELLVYFKDVRSCYQTY